MHQIHLKTLMLALGLAFGSAALAGGDKEVSITAPILNPVTNPLPINAAGTAAKNAQEGVHGAVTGTTGVVIPHYYVNVGVNGQTVPVDPFTINR